jgi:GMP synthase (glutamine-hydrolysing)
MPFQRPLPILTVVHQATSNPGLVGAILAEMGYSLDIRCLAVGDPLPPSLDHYSAALVFGGPMSANDDHLPFIRQELDWIPQVLAAQKPYLGICLGAQLLARTLGAKVAPHPDGLREIGYYPIVPTSLGRSVLPQPMVVYQWHQEGFELPHGAHLLAKGCAFHHQAFAYRRAYGLQFHPEITTVMVNHWTTEGADQLICPGAQGRAHHISHHRLYRQSVEQWLRRFLAQWLATPTQAEQAWSDYHSHSHSHPIAQRDVSRA